MKEQLFLLIELQKIDTSIGKMIIRKKEIPEKIKKMEEEFTLYTSNMQKEREKINELNKNHKEKEEKLKRGLDSMKKTKDRLFDVKTNKEYQAILKEIETIKEKNSETEDEIINSMEELENLRSLLRTKEKEFETFQQQYEENKKKLIDEKTLLEENYQKYQQNIREVASKLPRSLLKRYETIKGIGNGLAVVSVWKEVCSGCHMNIPPQLYNELQKNLEIHSCPNCNRIIYWQMLQKDNE